MGISTTEYDIIPGPPPPARAKGHRPNKLLSQLDTVVEKEITGPVRVARYDSPTGAARALRSLERATKNGDVKLAAAFDFQTRVLYDNMGRKIGSGLWVQVVGE